MKLYFNELHFKMQKLSLTLLFALFTLLLPGHTNEPFVHLWESPIIGYSNTSVINIKRVTFLADRTELDVCIKMPAGNWFSITKKTFLQADSVKHPLKEAIGIQLDNRITMTDSGKINFKLSFAPLSPATRFIHIIEPKGWVIYNIHNANLEPEGIADTYWRDEKTGEWIIGFTSQHVIYNNQFRDISTLEEQKNTYRLHCTNGKSNLEIKVGKAKNGKRLISIGKRKALKCNLIKTKTLPDYPTKDLRKGFIDSGYCVKDSVTLIGWLKDMPLEAWKKGGEFELTYHDIFSDEQKNAYTKMDSLGRFVIKTPMLNTSQVLLDWGRSRIETVLEPGKTYLLLSDFKNGQTLFMGNDARVQNELLTHSYSYINERINKKEADKIEALEFLARMEKKYTHLMNELQEYITCCPNLSQRYIDYVTGYYRAGQGESMMQARYSVKDRFLPKEYMNFVGEKHWQMASRPYTLYRDFNTFMRDYFDELKENFDYEDWLDVVLRMIKEGTVRLTEDESFLMKRYAENYRKIIEDVKKAKTKAEKEKLVRTFNTSKDVLHASKILERIQEPLQKEIALSNFRKETAIVDSVGCDQHLRDIHLARVLYKQIDQTRKPLDSTLIELMKKEIQLPIAKKTVADLQEKYLAIQNSDISRSPSLKSSNEVKEMSDGEQILRKLIAPYKGRMILLDIWGVWCSPCKRALSQSEEEFKRLAPYNMVFLYLANCSEENAWKNVIKEYNVIGDNVVHYNLPTEQQNAIEKFLNVQGFPTYKLIDESGNILDVNADPRNLNGLIELLESLQKK